MTAAIIARRHVDHVAIDRDAYGDCRSSVRVDIAPPASRQLGWRSDHATGNGPYDSASQLDRFVADHPTP
jgi:hypothetical protein